MLDLNAGFFAVAIPAVMIVGLSKGGFASGAGFAATPLLALVLPPSVALGVMLPLLMLMDLATVFFFRGQWDWRAARLLILGAVPGVVIGAMLYRITNPDVFRFLIGVMAVLFVAWKLAQQLRLFRPRARPFSDGAGVVAGALSGFTSFVAHAGSPPAAVYLLASGLDKTRYQATTVITFWAINVLKFIPYAWLGFFSAQTARADLYLAPFALLGAALGVRAHRLLSERLFFSMTYVALAAIGIKLIWDSLT